MTRLTITAAMVRAQLVARGTPVPPLAGTEDLLRRQLAIWIPLLRMRPRTLVRRAQALVIPVEEEDVEVEDGKRSKRS